MLAHAHGLTDSALEAIAGLERRVLAADGGRLKLGWGDLRTRPSDEARDLLWWDDGRLLGFLGIYGHSWDHLELTGMVDPDARRRGIGSALMDAVLPLCRAQGRDRLLLVVPRNCAGGDRFARSYAMAYEHSEHALSLRTRPAGAVTSSGLTLRRPASADIPRLEELYAEAFGTAPANLEEMIGRDSPPLIAALGDEVAGTVAAVREGERGAGSRVCQDLFDEGTTRVDLEVEVENDTALGLYTSTGFQLEATDDYYELALA